MSTYQINGRYIGEGYPTYIIAELSANHNQNYQSAVDLITQAYHAGADAIKLQTYRPDTITIDSNKPDFQITGTDLWDGQTLYQLYDKAYTPWEWHKDLKEYASSLGLDLFSSPFDVTAVDFLEGLNVPAYKIASCEITDHILIKKIAKTNKPVIISSGNASVRDLEEAVKVLRDNGCKQICMLKCTAAYPARKEDANITTIPDMMKRYNVVGGLSDHTLGIEVPTLSVAVGGSVIEKHFTLSRDSGSPDDAFSLTPPEFKQMVESVRLAESILGKHTYGGVKSEREIKKYRRSLYIVKDMKKGELFTEHNLKSIRPGFGLHTKHYDDVLGKPVTCDVEMGDRMSWELVYDTCIRKAEITEDDCRKLMEWRNHPDAIIHFYNTEPKVFDQFWTTYQQYFENKEILFFGQIDGTDICSIRLTPENNNNYHIGIVMNPEYKSKGFGTMFLNLIVDKLKESDIDRIFAEVKLSNTGSVRCFEKTDNFKFYKDLDKGVRQFVCKIEH